MTIDDWIEYYVPIVNREYGLSDKNAQSIAYFKNLKGVARFVCTKSYYIVYLVYPNMWGDKCFGVISFYIKPECRTLTMFLKVWRLINKLAKSKNVKYIDCGSHLNDKFNSFLIADGFHVATFRKEI